MKTPTRELARNRWHGILPEFGIGAEFLKSTHGPCPLCGGSDRFRWDNKDGLGTWICNACGAGDGFKLAQLYSGLSFAEVAKRIDEIHGSVDAKAEAPKQDAKKVKRRLCAIGRELQQVGDLDPVSRYLRRRGIKHIPRDYLRFHPNMAYYDKGQLVGHFPAMVASFRRPDGHIETFHVTYLTQDGHKAELPSARKVMGAQEGLNGCAIRLSGTAKHIGIAEGIETALSVTELYGIPCWACYSANGIQSFQPPEGVEQVTIFSDADASYTGQAAAYAAAKELTRKGYAVNVRADLQPGQDYNDVLMEASCQA